MKIKNEIKLDIHNYFNLKLIDKDGNIKQEAEAYNTVLNNFWNTANLTSNAEVYFHAIGIGTSAAEPVATQTDLQSRISNPIAATTVSTQYAYPTSSLTRQSTFPASSSYVGTIAEVGWYRGSSSTFRQCMTRALVQDIEGNPISIIKTDTDILIVTATVYVTINYPSYIIPVQPASNTLLTRLLSNSSYDGFGFALTGPRLASVASSSLNGRYTNLVTPNVGAASVNVATRTVSYPQVRTDTTAGNYAFANYLIMPHFGHIKLPNPSLFTPYRLQSMSVGTGDGAKTTFDCPIPDFIENTEIIKVAGVELVRNVDYTIDPIGNSANSISSKNAHSKDLRVAGGISAGSSDLNWCNPIAYNVITETSPIVFTADEPITCNCLFAENLKCRYYTASLTNLRFQYSTDGETWNTIIQITPLNTEFSVGDGVNQGNPYVFANPRMLFEPVTAKYWRFSVTAQWQDNTSRQIAFGGKQSFFGYVGNGIEFTTPPADGASIIISAEVDRPFKNSDYVIDMSSSISY